MPPSSKLKSVKMLLPLIPGIALMTRGPRFLVSMVFAITLTSSFIAAVIHVHVKGKGPEAVHAEIMRLEQTCLTAYAEQSKQGTVGVSGLPHNSLYSCGSFTVGELVMALGEPTAVSCLNYSKASNSPVVWIRFFFAGGRIEAFAMLPSDTPRLMPNDPIRNLVIYAQEAPVFPAHTTPWRGFTVMAAYKTCPPRTTEMLPYVTFPNRVAICSCS